MYSIQRKDLHILNSCYTLIMIALSIEDQKLFTKLLFLSDTFDNFELAEGEFVTRFSVNIDGLLTEEESAGRYIKWEEARGIAFQIIKGKQLPRAFRLTFRLTDGNMEKTLSSIGKTSESTKPAVEAKRVESKKQKLASSSNKSGVGA